MAGGFDGTQPNIVFIHAESMDGRKMGCMGHPAMQNATPHMDRLANEGTMFTNAYTNCPVCNPSRASMWTGKYPNFRDCWNNHEGLHDGVATYETTLNSAGYQTAAIGPLDYVYGKHSIRDRVGSWTRSAYVKRPISRTPMPRIVNDGDANARDWQHTHRSLSFLRDAANSPQPFWLYLTTGLVHPAFVAEKRHMGLIDESRIDTPPNLMPLSGSSHPADIYTRITKNCDKQFSENVVREIRHIYFAMIAALDEMVGRVLQAVDDLGLRDSTYVIFSSDHGEMAGEQNQVLKRTMYESSSHVPLIVRGPDVRKGATVDTPVSLVDLYPTMMDMARIHYADYSDRPGYAETLDGESLMPQLTGDSTDRRDWAMCEYHGDRVCTGTFMLRREDWKYIKHVGYDPQLFNLAADPWEMHNVAGDQPEVATELENLLANHFDCDGIDARAKQYDRENFVRWRETAKAQGIYEDTMAQVYSGFDRLCIEDVKPWTAEDEAVIADWLRE